MASRNRSRARTNAAQAVEPPDAPSAHSPGQRAPAKTTGAAAVPGEEISSRRDQLREQLRQSAATAQRRNDDVIASVRQSNRSTLEYIQRRRGQATGVAISPNHASMVPSETAQPSQPTRAFSQPSPLPTLLATQPHLQPLYLLPPSALPSTNPRRLINTESHQLSATVDRALSLATQSTTQRQHQQHQQQQQVTSTTSRMPNNGYNIPIVDHLSNANRRKRATNDPTTTMTTTGTTSQARLPVLSDDVDPVTQLHGHRDKPPQAIVSGEPVTSTEARRNDLRNIFSHNVVQLASSCAGVDQPLSGSATRPETGRDRHRVFGRARSGNCDGFGAIVAENSTSSIFISGTKTVHPDPPRENNSNHGNAQSQSIDTARRVVPDAVIASSMKPLDDSLLPHCCRQSRTATIAAVTTTVNNELSVPKFDCNRSKAQEPTDHEGDRVDRNRNDNSTVAPSVEEKCKVSQCTSAGAKSDDLASSVGRSAVVSGANSLLLESEPSAAVGRLTGVDRNSAKDTLRECSFMPIGPSSDPAHSDIERKSQQVRNSKILPNQRQQQRCNISSRGCEFINDVYNEDHNDGVPSAADAGRIGHSRLPIGDDRISKERTLVCVNQILANIGELQLAIGTVLDGTTATPPPPPPPRDARENDTVESRAEIESPFQGQMSRADSVAGIRGAAPSVVSSFGLQALEKAIRETIGSLEQAAFLERPCNVNNHQNVLDYHRSKSARGRNTGEMTSCDCQTELSGLGSDMYSMSTQTEWNVEEDFLHILPLASTDDRCDNVGARVEHEPFPVGDSTCRSDNNTSPLNYHSSENDGCSMHPNMGDSVGHSDYFQWFSANPDGEDSSVSSRSLSASSSSSSSSSSPSSHNWSPRVVVPYFSTEDESRFHLTHHHSQLEHSRDDPPSSVSASFEMDGAVQTIDDVINNWGNYMDERENVEEDGMPLSTVRNDQQADVDNAQGLTSDRRYISDGSVENEINGMIEDHLALFGVASAAATRHQQHHQHYQQQQQQQQQQHQLVENHSDWYRSLYSGGEMRQHAIIRHIPIHPMRSIFNPVRSGFEHEPMRLGHVHRTFTIPTTRRPFSLPHSTGTDENRRISINDYQLEEDTPEPFNIEVDRSSRTLIDDLINVYTSVPIGFLYAPLKITFRGEPGVDYGALTREYFHLIFHLIISGEGSQNHQRAAFEGRWEHFLPAVDHVLTDSRVFWFVGVLSAQAAFNGCRGFPGLCLALRRFLGAAGARVSRVPELAELIEIDDIADLELRDLITKLENEVQLSDDDSDALQRWLDDSKYTKVLRPSNMRQVAKHLLRYYVFDSRMSQLQAIAEGLDELEWRSAFGGYFDENAVFPKGPERTTLGEFFNAVRISNDSDTSVLAHRARKFFVRYCRELDEGNIDELTLGTLLMFFTGDPCLPTNANAVGIVSFAESDDTIEMPRARTCSYELILPVCHTSYERFRDSMSLALRFGTIGFGLA